MPILSDTSLTVGSWPIGAVEHMAQMSVIPEQVTAIKEARIAGSCCATSNVVMVLISSVAALHRRNFSPLFKQRACRISRLPESPKFADFSTSVLEVVPAPSLRKSLGGAAVEMRSLAVSARADASALAQTSVAAASAAMQRCGA